MMQNKLKADIGWLSNPEVFAVGTLPPHSDHFYFESEEEMAEWKDTGVESSISLRQSLNGTWKFSYAQNPPERKKDFFQLDYDCENFDDIKVPGHIQLQGYDKCQYINTMYPWDGLEYLRPPMVSEKYNPVGSYVKYFDVNEALRGKRIFLSFQGVETAMYVWINGHFLGYGEDAFTPTEFELTPYIREKNNKLSVEVYKRSSASWIEDQDFFRFSGIFREVFLYAIPKVHVRDLKVTASLDDTLKNGILKVCAEILSQGEADESKDEEYQIHYELLDDEGNCVAAGERLNEEVIVEGIKPWSAEFPNLYQLVIRVKDSESHLIEAVKQPIGFRRFEMKNGLMCLNGKRIVFHGVNRHEFCCETGRVLPYDKMVQDIRIMKENHINAVRTSHYPNQPAWYRLCDRYGIYLIDETNLESHGSWQKMGAVEPSWNVPGNKKEWEENVINRAKAMYERDKNHASVLIWSCGNESYAGEDIRKMAEFFRNADKERLVHYEGCVHNREYEDCTDMESRMYAKPEEIEAYLKDNPQKPYISCEYMHAMGNSCGGLLQYQELEHKYEKYQGGFIWDFVDQAILTEDGSGKRQLRYGGDFDDRATDYHFCGNGLLFADRTLTPKMQEVRFLYQDVHLDPDETGVLLTNHFLFDHLNGCQLVIWAEWEGGIIKSISYEDICVKPMESAYFAADFLISDMVEEYTMNARLLKDSQEIAHGQSVWKNKNYRVPVVKKMVERNIVEGDVNIGMIMPKTTYLFSLSEGGLVSLNHQGREHVVRPPKISFWRALTDNDLGGKSGFDRAGWMTAGLFSKVERIEKDLNPMHPFMNYHYVLPGIPDGNASIRYELLEDGALFVQAFFPGTKILKEMPVFAVDFMLKGEYEQFSYYGNGPDECQIDRSEGAFLGNYESTARENVTRNLRPQECGNRTGVRKLLVLDLQGRGLCFEQMGKPFEMSVLPYSAYELENALHQEELPQSSYTWVRIAFGQMGVGGDDSWGAPVRPQYMLNAEEPVRLEFKIYPVER
ncbi:MAG: glycoside hydrolase family 2 TIM barrel-domain containing protein [Thermoflexaceae bacterium]|nr:glycoside hydrolase family 2 TIM barrel-domain containing protein [Thermoflexaceae bacterium]